MKSRKASFVELPFTASLALCVCAKKKGKKMERRESGELGKKTRKKDRVKEKKI